MHRPGGYRPEIDGLRAVAVVPVVLYHAHMPGVSGGFVGVDVFFVISGFLITSILAADVAAGRFSIVTFYERRVRRIFPALFVMLAVAPCWRSGCCCPSSWRISRRASAASALFVSNFYFWQRDRLFRRGGGRRKPLLHTWSLAIEEQFYIFFPLWLWAMSRWAPRLAAAGDGGGARCASLVALHRDDASAERRRPSSTRRRGSGSCWPGSVLALAAAAARCRGRVAQALGGGGLALIAAAVFGFDARTPFPGARGDPAGGGNGAGDPRLTGANRTSAGALLSLGPVRFVGLISYSLYLWHWPLLVFYRFWRGGAAGRLGDRARRHRPRSPRRRSPGVSSNARSGCAALARAPRRRSSPAASVAMAAAMAFGSSVAGRGLPGRVPAAVQALADDSRSTRWASPDCDSLPGGRPCVIGAGGAAAQASSSGATRMPGMLMPAFEAAARDGGTTGLYLGAAGCVPLLGVEPAALGLRGVAPTATSAILAAIAARPELGTVVLVSRWAFYADGERFGARAGPPVFIRDGGDGRVSLAENGRVFERGSSGRSARSRRSAAGW